MSARTAAVRARQGETLLPKEVWHGLRDEEGRDETRRARIKTRSTEYAAITRQRFRRAFASAPSQ